MNIILIIRKENGPSNSESLLGHIAITDGSRTIRARNTYIDSWFDALTRGLQAVRLGSTYIIDLIDEPDPLIFEVEEQELWIRYGDGAVNVGTIEEFTRKFRFVAAFFLDTVRAEFGDAADEVLQTVDEFVVSQAE